MNRLGNSVSRRLIFPINPNEVGISRILFRQAQNGGVDSRIRVIPVDYLRGGKVEFVAVIFDLPNIADDGEIVDYIPLLTQNLPFSHLTNDGKMIKKGITTEQEQFRQRNDTPWANNKTFNWHKTTLRLSRC